MAVSSQTTCRFQKELLLFLPIVCMVFCCSSVKGASLLQCEHQAQQKVGLKTNRWAAARLKPARLGSGTSPSHMENSSSRAAGQVQWVTRFMQTGGCGCGCISRAGLRRCTHAGAFTKHLPVSVLCKSKNSTPERKHIRAVLFHTPEVQT